jgi:hypothetical protein
VLKTEKWHDRKITRPLNLLVITSFCLQRLPQSGLSGILAVADCIFKHRADIRNLCKRLDEDVRLVEYGIPIGQNSEPAGSAGRWSMTSCNMMPQTPAN